MAASIGHAGKGGGQGKPAGNSGGSTMALVMYTDINGDGLPNYGDTITFDVSTTATAVPVVSLTCSQNGVEVLHGKGDFFDGSFFSWTRLMKLSSQAWTGGAADCTAVLGYDGRHGLVSLSTLNFHVAD